MGPNKSTPIPPDFEKHSHRKLLGAIVSKNQQSIELFVPYGQLYQQWRWNLYPISSYHKHMLLPIHFVDSGVNMLGCSTQEKHKFSSTGFIVCLI